MGRIRVSTVINASPERVWEEVRHIDRHVDWMADAESITFRSHQTSGAGTTFDCVTKVGPVKLVDKMAITQWREGEEMGVRHDGLVTGIGRFTLARIRRDHTRFTWDEDLVFPWWMAGRVGGVLGGVIMRRIWKRNLRVLKALVESGRS
ncbi:MAG: SRPBCC family protein [Acidimicrobiia bacterium]|nr:SRPBCC family protein [Acidimicrobiia bacterium]